MKRRWFTLAGAIGIAVAVGVAGLFPDVVLAAPTFALWVSTFLVAGVLAILGGDGRSVVGLRWQQLLGLSHIVFAVGMVGWQGWEVWMALTHHGVEQLGIATADHVHGPALKQVLWPALFVLGQFSLLFIGFDLVRGPKHFDHSRLEPGPIVGSHSECRVHSMRVLSAASTVSMIAP